MSEMEKNEFEATTATEQTTENFANALDALTETEDDEDSEETKVSLVGLGRDALAIWKLGELAVGAWNGFKRRIVSAEQRKQEKAEKPSLKERFTDKFKKQTETPTSTEEKSVENKSESSFDSLSLEQILAYTQAIEEAKQQKLKQLEEARKNLDDQINAIK